MNFLSVNQAVEIIENTSYIRESELLEIEKSQGRILSQAIYATREQPPFDRVTMDGIAICLDQNNHITVENNEFQNVMKY